MCGEKAAKVIAVVTLVGSPPRVRGKVSYPVVVYASRRITPACAGKSVAGQLSGRHLPDHPRVCGEKGTTRNNADLHRGSPPRVRGKVCDGVRIQAPVGITPACAGKSCNDCKHRDKREDHPRVCGEKPIARSPSGVFKGSPPRVRGKGERVLLQSGNQGITPACAGKSLEFSPMRSML